MKKWPLDYDEIKFCNHLKESNIVSNGNILVAKKDIKICEELNKTALNFKKLENFKIYK